MNAAQFEEEFGTNALLKASVSALNKLLVSKGIVTEQELQDALNIEIADHWGVDE